MMKAHRTCDGMVRRDFMKVGALACGGLSLPGLLRMTAAGELDSNQLKSAIFVNLPGGPSHLDTFDMKPDAPSEFRGTFNPIDTNVPGMQICEHLPRLAQCADKFAIVRGVSHTLAAHRLGAEYVNTGTRPLASLEYPGYGCVVTKETETTNPDDLPPFVSIPNSAQRPGYLGVQYAPLSTNAAPRQGQPFGVRGISLSGGVTIDQIDRRTNLLRDLDSTFRGLEQKSQLIDGLDQFSQQAYDMITSTRAREAFDVSRESPSFSEQFTGDPFSQSCLLATRLVEAGVRFVSLNLGGWDTHLNNFTRLKDQLLPRLDNGLAPLLTGLEQKGLLTSTAVFVTGEFGRTPKINDRTAEGGRDHYPRCMFMLMAGGDVNGGQVVGQSDAHATEPAADGYTPDDLAATFYHNVGIDHTKEYHTETGRPVMIVRDGHIVRELFS